MARLLAIRSEEGRGVYKFQKNSEIETLLLKHTKKLDGYSYRIFNENERKTAQKWIKEPRKVKLLAIRSEIGRGVYEYATAKEKNELFIKHAGKLDGVSHRTFQSNQKQDALIWAGLDNPTNTKVEKKASLKKQKDETKTKPIPRKMPREIELDVIHIGMDCRTYLQWYYAEGGDSVAHGDFKGRVEKIDNRGILFKRLYIEFFDQGWDGIEGKEDHIWIYDKEPFIKKKVKVGDCVAFTGLAYAYKRNDDSIDFSLKECEDIEIIDEYELPTDEALDRQSAERLACEVCLYSEHCDGLVCIAADGYLETMTAQILEAQKNLKETVK